MLLHITVSGVIVIVVCDNVSVVNVAAETCNVASADSALSGGSLAALSGDSSASLQVILQLLF